HIFRLKLKYNSTPGNKKKFVDIPAQAQTVIVSVSFQYGVGLSVRAPKFWKAVTSQDWPETIKILRSFRDAYPTRRRKEAALMEKIK
ncbi:MAG TPA: peptidase, partial [Chromatiales bacterium]|nr:peptidase [Chromatiales bacterium]HEX23222.1 peptidase [Chromatiales bacterium]